MSLIELTEIHKTYRSGSLEVVALGGITLTVNDGEYVAVMGPSGSGKSTLMHIIGCLDVPSAGSYHLTGEDVSAMSEDQLADVRNRRIGFVFQQFNLLASMPAWRNVELPLTYSGIGRAERRERAITALDWVGLGDRVQHRPGELSGGEQQRVALARALITQPKLLLADEPTGDLDGQTAQSVFALIARLHREHQLTSLIATHNLSFARRCHRVLRLERGRLEEVHPESLAV